MSDQVRNPDQTFSHSEAHFQDVDDFFESEKSFLVEYHLKIKDATGKSDRMTKIHKSKFF